MTAILLPGGALADRYGQTRVMRTGLLVFAAASLACSMIAASTTLILARFVQGAGAALALPAALALLRGANRDPLARARLLGLWAAWTGVAGAVGPLLAGLLADTWSWRAVFVLPAAGGVVATLLLRVEPRQSPGRDGRPIPARATASLMAVLGGMAFLLITSRQPASGTVAPAQAAALIGVVVAGIVFVRDARRSALLPREMMTARNCLAANGVTFALYFGMFGLSFIVALYAQYVLEYSALTTALVLLPISLMLFLAEWFGRLAASVGARLLVAGGSVACAAGIAWIAAAAHPVPVLVLVVGSAGVGLGLSLAVSPLTHAAVAAVPESCAGAASALNHATVRTAGLVAVALLGSIAADPAAVVSADGVRHAMIVCAAIVAAGGLTGSFLLRDDDPGGLSAREVHAPQHAFLYEGRSR
jgi:hypothetical protein